MYMNLTCVKNSINGQDIYTCVKETKPTDNVEHFGFARNDERIQNKVRGAIIHADDVIRNIPAGIQKFIALNNNNPSNVVMDNNPKPLIRKILTDTLVGEKLQCNPILPAARDNNYHDPGHEPATTINGNRVIMDYPAQETTINNPRRDANGVVMFNHNDLYLSKTNELYDWYPISYTPTSGAINPGTGPFICTTNPNPVTIEGIPQLLNKVWKVTNHELGTNQCTISNKCREPLTMNSTTMNLRPCVDYKCVAMPKKENQGYWMHATIPTNPGPAGALPVLNYNPTTSTVISTQEMAMRGRAIMINNGTVTEYQESIQPIPQWARYVDITIIGKGGDGGAGGNGYHGRNNRGQGYTKKGSGGGGGGSGGYVKIKRLFLLQGTKLPGRNELSGTLLDGLNIRYQPSANKIIVYGVNSASTSIPELPANLDSIATVTSGNNGTDGQSGGTSGGDGDAVSGGRPGTYKVSSTFCGADQIFTKPGATGGSSNGSPPSIGGAGGSGYIKKTRVPFNPISANVPTNYAFGAGGAGGNAGTDDDNRNKTNPTAGNMGCVIITYYYNSIDETSIED